MQSSNTDFSAIQQIGDASVEGVLIYSFAEGSVIYTNSSVRNLIGLKNDTSRHGLESILKRVAPQDQAYLKMLCTTISDRPSTTGIEVEFVNDDTKRTTVCCDAFLIANNSAIVVFIKDITEAKQHDNYLIEFGTRKNTVLDTLGHHISSALTLMQHLSTEAKKYIQSTNDKNLSVYLDLLHENSEHSLSIIYNVLLKEHNQSPLISVKKSKINLIEKISFIYEELVQSYQSRKFIFLTSTESLYVNVDDIKLLQIVNNFTSNAIKFSPTESPITIRVSGTEADFTVSVEDRGIGIPDTLRPFIFERRLGGGRRGLNGENSIGLGLSICYNLIQLMNGKIWFDSEEGKGSTFYFTLPKS